MLIILQPLQFNALPWESIQRGQEVKDLTAEKNTNNLFITKIITLGKSLLLHAGDLGDISEAHNKHDVVNEVDWNSGLLIDYCQVNLINSNPGIQTFS